MILILNKQLELIKQLTCNEPVFSSISATSMTEQGKTKRLLKIVLRTCAMQLVKLGMHPQQIDIVLSNMLWSLKVSGNEISSYGGLYTPYGGLYKSAYYCRNC